MILPNFSVILSLFQTVLPSFCHKKAILPQKVILPSFCYKKVILPSFCHKKVILPSFCATFCLALPFCLLPSWRNGKMTNTNHCSNNRETHESRISTTRKNPLSSSMLEVRTFCSFTRYSCKYSLSLLYNSCPTYSAPRPAFNKSWFSSLAASEALFFWAGLVQ